MQLLDETICKPCTRFSHGLGFAGTSYWRFPRLYGLSSEKWVASVFPTIHLNLSPCGSAKMFSTQPSAFHLQKCCCCCFLPDSFCPYGLMSLKSIPLLSFQWVRGIDCNVSHMLTLPSLTRSTGMDFQSDCRREPFDPLFFRRLCKMRGFVEMLMDPMHKKQYN